MRKGLPIVVGALTILFIAINAIGGGTARATSPDGAVHALLNHVRGRDWTGAMRFVANANNISWSDLANDLGGNNASLKTYSSLEEINTSVLHQNDHEAMVRTNLVYSSAVGKLTDTRDLRVVREGDQWKVDWPVTKQAKVPPQVIPVNYLRWDIVYRGSDEDWGAQNVDPPKVRIISMNAIERDIKECQGTAATDPKTKKPLSNKCVVIMGELINEDTVPGFVTVNAVLRDAGGSELGNETAFDKMNHILLPKEVTGFRIDFPGISRAQAAKVDMDPRSMLVGASADPVIGALHQRIEKDERGRPLLKGEVVNQSGQTVNIAHLIATFYDSEGRVVWVDDGYVKNALLPNTPEPFEIALRQDLGDNVQYRVVVNQYSLNGLGR